MALIKSISGIRGTIGGIVNNNLTPIDAVKFAAAYGSWLINRNANKSQLTVVIGRDARISGKMISSLVANTLVGLGINVIDLANYNSCSFIATQDLGKVYKDDSFEIIGRFDNSDIRGCNLMLL